LQTFDTDDKALLGMMLRSREACVDYMMPLGLHHIFKFDHHMGPQPGGYIARYPIEWCPVYYHRANSDSIGVDRSSTGTNATAQYREPYCSLYDNIETCPERFLLWFHRVPWTRRMNSGRTLWEELQWCYNRGVREVDEFATIWQSAKPLIDEQRWTEVTKSLEFQQQDARLWRDVCLEYFGQFANKTK
jgi:alpha-glucuronidase